jgi:hypothetical protein
MYGGVVYIPQCSQELFFSQAVRKPESANDFGNLIKKPPKEIGGPEKTGRGKNNQTPYPT